LIGLLYKDGLLEGPQALFCPSEPLERWQYQTAENPWPPVETPSGTQQTTRCGYGTRPTVNWREDGLWPLPLPRLTKFKNRAIVADLAPTPFFIDRRHRSGLNVCYADGSAKWITRESVDGSLNGIPDLITAFDPGWNDRMLDTSVDPAVGMWARFDKE
jgi:prepilin-type processing-associated H-X9-DG protein